MGQKVNPKIFRTTVITTWPSHWFSSKKNYPRLLQDDLQIRKFLKKRLLEADIAKIEIERSAHLMTILLHSAKPGLIIGRGGQGAEELKKEISTKFLRGNPMTLQLNIQEVQKPLLSADIVLRNIIADLEKRIPFRRAMKQAVGRTEKAGAIGVKVLVSGRLDGAEIARREKLVVGKIPLHTLRADIDYSRGKAQTIYGAIGVKVWIYRGEIFKKDKE